MQCIRYFCVECCHGQKNVEHCFKLYVHSMLGKQCRFINSMVNLFAMLAISV